MNTVHILGLNVESVDNRKMLHSIEIKLILEIKNNFVHVICILCHN